MNWSDKKVKASALVEQSTTQTKCPSMAERLESALEKLSNTSARVKGNILVHIRYWRTHDVGG